MVTAKDRKITQWLLQEKIHLFNAETGWSIVLEVPRGITAFNIPEIDSMTGGFRYVVYHRTEDEDDNGLAIFR